MAAGAARGSLALRAFEAVIAGANVAATAWILLIMGLVVADVVGRNAFAAPVPGVTEMVKYSIVGIVFLQLAHTHRAGAMIRSDGVLGWIARARPRAGAALDAAAQVAGCLLTLLVAYAALPRLERAFLRGEYEGAAGHFTLPVWPFILLVIAGSLLLSLSFLAAGLRALRAAAAAE